MNEEKRVEIYKGAKGEIVFSVDPEAECVPCLDIPEGQPSVPLRGEGQGQGLDSQP